MIAIQRQVVTVGSLANNKNVRLFRLLIIVQQAESGISLFGTVFPDIRNQLQIPTVVQCGVHNHITGIGFKQFFLF